MANEWPGELRAEIDRLRAQLAAFRDILAEIISEASCRCTFSEQPCRFCRARTLLGAEDA